MIKDPFESRIFGKAMAARLGLDPKRVTLVTIEARNGGLLTAQVTVTISADDLAAVAERMKASRVIPPPPPPPAPLARHVRTDCGYVCNKCGSSAKRQWLFGAIKCIHPQCGHERGSRAGVEPAKPW